MVDVDAGVQRRSSLSRTRPQRVADVVLLRRHLGVRRAVVEVALIGGLYVFYCASRMLASDAFAPARGHALDILAIEKAWRIDIEAPLNRLFADVHWLGVASSFWYATTHYIVTAGILIWLYRRSHWQYVIARRALVLATVIGLVFYLFLPTAPPRLVDGKYVDVLAEYQTAGWWGADASAPKGLGGLTNELAAFPSLHAGWALWVALVLIWMGVPKTWRVIGLVYAAVMTIDIIGTGNHWLLDAVVGWAVVLVAWAVVQAVSRRDAPLPETDVAGDDLLDEPQPATG
ncbi:MAG: inositol phosphorylceramide synthase [Actinomycetales bacterium]|nr:MAG: inositol phosphorylceramide synthase [Actinomycetales bacterium]